MKKRKIQFIDFLILIIALLILLAILSVVLVVAFPEAAKGTATNLRARITPIITRPAKVFSQLGRRGEAGYNYRIKPLLKTVSDIGASKKPGKLSPGSGVDFSKCINCHKDLFDTAGANHIYIDHRIHQTQNVECDDCHSSGHKNNKVKAPVGKVVAVPEAICLSCHKQDKDSGNCKKCHMPGSLLKAIAPAKINNFFAHRTVDKKILVPVGFQNPVGDLSKPCRQCHDYPDFCSRCHAMKTPNIVTTPHDNNWIPTHGIRILQGELTTKGCWQCHNSNFCAGACHPNPGRQRDIGPKWPLPDRRSVVKGKWVDRGGRRIIKKKIIIIVMSIKRL